MLFDFVGNITFVSQMCTGMQQCRKLSLVQSGNESYSTISLKKTVEVIYIDVPPIIACVWFCYAPCSSDTDGCRPMRLRSDSVGPPLVTLRTPGTALHNLSQDTTQSGYT